MLHMRLLRAPPLLLLLRSQASQPASKRARKERKQAGAHFGQQAADQRPRKLEEKRESRLVRHFVWRCPVLAHPPHTAMIQYKTSIQNEAKNRKLQTSPVHRHFFVLLFVCKCKSIYFEVPGNSCQAVYLWIAPGWADKFSTDKIPASSCMYSRSKSHVRRKSRKKVWRLCSIQVK